MGGSAWPFAGLDSFPSIPIATTVILLNRVSLWRIINYRSRDGAGGLLVSSRWHLRGRPVAYLTLHPTTALLETLVSMEIDAEDLPA